MRSNQTSTSRSAISDNRSSNFGFKSEHFYYQSRDPSSEFLIEIPQEINESQQLSAHSSSTQKYYESSRYSKSLRCNPQPENIRQNGSEGVSDVQPSVLSRNSEESSNSRSSFSARCVYYDITAQKSKINNLSSMSENQNIIEVFDQLNQILETPELEKFSKEMFFQSRETPKMSKELPIKSKKEERIKEKFENQQPRNRAQDAPPRYTFVKLQNTEMPQRKYPYRLSREIPRLEYWKGEKADMKKQGYWKRCDK